MDTIAGYLTYKLANKFGLRTPHGKMDFALFNPVPGINVGDLIVLVVARENGAILHISDLTTGTWYTERPVPPFQAETVGLAPLIFFCLFIGVLPLAGYGLGLAHIPAAFALSLIAMSLMFGFLDTWRRTRNHNVRLMDKIQQAALNASADPAIWDVPETGSPRSDDALNR